MESQLLHEIIEEGFDAVESFLDIKPSQLATIHERVEQAVTGKGALARDDARLLHWVTQEWGERLVALRATGADGFDVASDRVTRLIALVKLTLAARGEAPDGSRPTNGPQRRGTDSAPSRLERPR
jgi:hypothetical protein